MSKSNSNWIGITIGDPAGIGPEVVAKALLNRSVQSCGPFKIIGDAKVFQKYFPKKLKSCQFIDLNNIKTNQLNRRPNRPCGLAAIQYIDHSIELLKQNEIRALVTAPVSKEAVHLTGIPFPGHTEYLASAFHVNDFGMMFVTDTLKTIIVTRHIPISKVSHSITKDEIMKTIRLAHQALKNYFQLTQPRIAVCGLNPHAGERGGIGREEIEVIIPAIVSAKKEGIKVSGPYAADTLFVPKSWPLYDAVVAMYHDQGLIPIKTLHFKEVVNLTVGLPFIRTSPAHGTAFDIAGKNKADPSSMIESIKLAAALSKKRNHNNFLKSGQPRRRI